MKKTWVDIFKECERSLRSIESIVDGISKLGEVIVPSQWVTIYKPFLLTPFDEVKVVIIGQDPYPNRTDATGLAFSVNRSMNLPRSLRNIFKELKADLALARNKGDLKDWAEQGVLLLNSHLTTEEGVPGAHTDLGWDEVTDKVINEVSKKKRVVFMLWGKEAQKKKDLIVDGNLILEAPHPSPNSAHTGFFGCKHFSQTNQYLRLTGQGGVKWW